MQPRTRTRTRTRLTVAAVVGLLALGASVAACEALRRTVVKVYPQSYRAEGDAARPTALFLGRDEQRPRLAVTLTKVAGGFTTPTAAEFVPGEPELLVVLEKGGALKWASPRTGESAEALRLEVTTASEQGLLGLAFHPDFPRSRRFFLHYTTVRDGKDVSRVEAWRADGASFASATLRATGVLLEVEQPYANHNGGHLAFGPDGFLYVGYGDGGFRDDPHGNGQRPDALLGKMLRLDVEAAGAKPEVWALGCATRGATRLTPKGASWSPTSARTPGKRCRWWGRAPTSGGACARRGTASGRRRAAAPTASSSPSSNTGATTASPSPAAWW